MKRPTIFTNFFWVCISGALGTGVRYAIILISSLYMGMTLPFGTFIANVTGSFLATFIATLSFNAAIFSESTRTFLMLGFLGGLTTYSGFNFEVIGFFQEGAILKGIGYFALMTVTCLVAGGLGLLAGHYAAS